MTQCHMGEYEENTPINREHFDDVLCDGSPVWNLSKEKGGEVRNLEHQSMNMKAKLWWTVVQGIILPIKHRNTITHKRLWCLRVLMLDQPMDLGLTIAREIKLLHKRRMGSLTYVGIISELCRKAGVDFENAQKMDAGKIDLSWLFENLPEPKQKGKGKGKVESPKAETLKGEGSSSNLSEIATIHENLRTISQQLELQYLMAPIVIEIAERLGIDASSLRDSPLLKREHFGQFKEPPSKETPISPLRPVPSSPPKNKSQPSPASPTHKTETTAAAASKNSSSSSSSSSETDSEPLRSRRRPQGVYNPLNVEIPMEPVEAERRDSLTPATSDVAEGADVPKLGLIESQHNSAWDTSSPSSDTNAPISGSLQLEVTSPKGFQHPEAEQPVTLQGSNEPQESANTGSTHPKVSYEEMRRDIEGTSSSQHSDARQKSPRDPSISMLHSDSDEEGDIDTTRLEEIIASIQPDPPTDLTPLDLSKPLFITDALASAAIEAAAVLEEEPVQPSVAEEATSSIQPSMAEEQPHSPSLRDAAQLLVSAFSSATTNIPNLNLPAPPSPINIAPTPGVYRRKKGRKASSAEPHQTTPPPQKQSSRSASPK